jgi:phage/plasmid-associated DNA primase
MDDWDSNDEDVAQKNRDSNPADVIIRQNYAPSISKLYSWLRSGNFSTASGNPLSTITDLQYKRSYYIPAPSFGQFLDILEVARKDGRVFHITERQYTAEVEYSGIMIDLDIYQPIKDTQMSEDVATRLFNLTAEVLRSVLDFPDGSKYNIYIISKPQPVSDGDRYKDGHHILIPGVQVSKQVKSLIFEQIARARGFADTFSRFALCPESIWPNLLDTNSRAAPVFFYGSCKLTSSTPYILKYATSITVDYGMIMYGPINVDKFAETHNLCYELSLTYSASANKAIYQHSPRFDSALGAVKIIEDTTVLTEEEQLAALLASSVNARMLRDTLDILTEDYAKEYQKWFGVICAIAHESRDYKPVARWFSKKDESYTANGFDKAWEDAKRYKPTTPLTLRSINYWAMRCSPARYKSVRSTNYVEIAKAHVLKHDGQLNHSVVAAILYQLANHRFFTDVMQGKNGKYGYVWYEFVMDGMSCREGGIYKWREEYSPDTLHMMVPAEIDEIFTEVMRFLKESAEATPEESLAKWYKEVIKNLKRCRNSLGIDGFQNGVISQAKFLFRNRRLADELDKQPDLFGCGNGVLQIGAVPKLYNYYHEFLVSKFTKVPYFPFSRDNQYVCELLQAFREIYIEPDVFMFMLFFYSTALSGEVKPPIMLMSFAGGQNAKTFAAYMTRQALGKDYSCGLKPALLTAPAERAESANAAVMAMKDKRFCYFDEFNEADAINTARLKSIVNPAKQDNRGLYSGQEEMENTATIQVISNFPLNCDTQDHGTWRRIKKYSNKVKFIEHPDPNNPYEKKERSEIIEKWPKDQKYLAAWISILAYFYARLQTQYRGRIKEVPCPTIEHETEIFRNSQDMINCYITVGLFDSPSADPFPLDTLITRYREWFSSRHRRAAPQHSTLAPLFKSSRISKYIKLGGGAEDYVEGIRVRGVDDRLAPGETSFAAPPPPTNLPRVPDKFSFDEFDIFQ